MVLDLDPNSRLSNSLQSIFDWLRRCTLVASLRLGSGRKEEQNMPRIEAIRPDETTGKTKQLLDAVQAQLGMTPNLMRTLAHSAAALEAYLNFGAALSKGQLDAGFREQIALTVAQANSCEYCLSAHSALGGMVGLKPEEIASSREAHAQDSKRDAGLQFAQALVVQRGQVSDQAIARLRAAGYSDGEIAEIVANVAVNIFTNYFNHVARTDVDFPKVGVSLQEAAAR